MAFNGDDRGGTVKRIWDENEYRVIAQRSNSKQAVEDVKYARAVRHWNKGKFVSIIIPDIAIGIGQINKAGLRIICIAVSEEYKGRGFGTYILNKLQGIALREGARRIYTRTREGFAFYSKNHFKPVSTKGKDYVMEKMLWKRN